MAQFDTTIEKLQKVFEEIEKNKSLIETKDNTEKLNFFSELFTKQDIKFPIEVFNTGEKFVTNPATTESGSTAVKGEQVPASVSYSETIDIELPEILLPFVQYNVNVTAPPQTEIHGIFVSDPSTWIGDHIDIRGDGQIIYRGFPLLDTSFSEEFITRTTEFIQNAGISLTHTKEAFRVNLDFIPEDTRGGAFGFILTYRTNDIVAVGTCTPKVDGVFGTPQDTTRSFVCNHRNNKNHKIISMTPTSITSIGNETITTPIPDIIDIDNTDCIDESVTTENVTRTHSFASVLDYSLTLAEPSNTGLTYSKATIAEITEVVIPGRWIFYSTDLIDIVKIKSIGREGDFQEVILQNLPEKEFDNPEDPEEVTRELPYTSITVKRNVEGTNPAPTIIKFSEGGFGGNRSIKLTRSGRESENYVKITTNDGTPKWRFLLNGSFVFVGKATNLIFVTRFKSGISTQEFESTDTNKFQAIIDKNENTELTGIVANIFYKQVTQGVEGLPGSVTKEFFTDPNSNSLHGILALTPTQFTAVGDEIETIIPINPELPPVITKRNNIIQIGLIFASSTDYSIGIIDTVDFPVYNDIYTPEGDTYEISTEDHTFLSKEVWGTSSNDLILNIRATLINPLYWREERKYNKNDI